MKLFDWFSKRAITTAQGQAAGLLHAPSRSGVVVDETSALGVSAVWCAVKVISEAVGSLPLCVYKTTPDGGRDVASDHALFPLLNSEPNPELTRPVFFEVMMSHALLWGGCYAEIERNNRGEPIALWPISPQYVQVLRDSVTGQLLYRINLPINVLGNPADGGHPVILRGEDVLSVPGLSPDGSAGYSILRVARDNIGFSIACDRFGSSYFGNNARLAGFLKTPNRLSDEARENVKLSFAQMWSGVDKAGSTALLEEGLAFEPVTYSDNASMYTITRQFQITEIARLFNISPVKLHELGRATWANLSVLNTDFYVTTLRPWLEKIECEIERKLEINGEYFLEFDADEYLRGDITTRYANHQIAIAAGFKTVDEVRAEENLPPMPKPPAPPIPEAPMTPEAEPTEENVSA